MAIYTRYRLYRTVGGQSSARAWLSAARPIWWLWLPAVAMVIGALWLAL